MQLIVLSIKYQNVQVEHIGVIHGRKAAALRATWPPHRATSAWWHSTQKCIYIYEIRISFNLKKKAISRFLIQMEAFGRVVSAE